MLKPWPKSVFREGTVSPLDRNGEHISDAALGLNNLRDAGVAFELASEAKKLHVDAAIEDILIHARGLQQVLTAKWALRRIRSLEGQAEQALGNPDIMASSADEAVRKIGQNGKVRGRWTES